MQPSPSEQQPKSSESEPKYDPSLEVPPEIQETAHKVGVWCVQNGWRDWEICCVADRKLVNKLRQQLAEKQFPLHQENSEKELWYYNAERIHSCKDHRLIGWAQTMQGAKNICTEHNASIACVQGSGASAIQGPVDTRQPKEVRIL
jgi:hypothetical protein